MGYMVCIMYEVHGMGRKISKILRCTTEGGGGVNKIFGYYVVFEWSLMILPKKFDLLLNNNESIISFSKSWVPFAVRSKNTL